MAGEIHNGGGKFRFVSLHRKWLLSLGFLLFILSAIFGVLNYRSLNELVESQQEASQTAWRSEFKGLIDHSVDRLQRLGVVLASLGKLTEHLNESGAFFDSLEFGQQFTSVRYELDVDRIMLFDKTGRIRWNWASRIGGEFSMQPMLDAIARIKTTEQPEAALDCQAQCGLSVVMPLLKDGKNIGFIGLNQRITDLVLEFSTATGVDIGLLTGLGNGNETSFPRWRLYSPALTHASTLKPLMTSLSERYASPAAIPSDVEWPWHGESYRLHVLPLDDIVKGTKQGYLVFIADVTKTSETLHQSLRNSLLLMVYSLLFAEIFLFLFLRRPLWRLEQLAATLPLVAQGNYRDAYKRFNRQKRPTNSHDEIDMLYQSSYELTSRIEEQQLALASDRDFIQSILDSVQVMILTQTRDGKIHTVNRYMAQLLGQSIEVLKGRLFIELVEDGMGKDYYDSNRINLVSSSLHRLEHEGSVIDAKGEQRHIIWLHTYIGQTQLNDVVVLSVGMDATDRILAENRSRWLAYHDPLTGLSNRLRFYEELERSFADSVRNDVTHVVLLLDLDHFKTVNDTSGHAAGDTLLVLLANELRARVRKSDLVARLGGDEFVVLMPNTSAAGAEAFAGSLNGRLGQRKFQFDNKEYQITASIGIALMPQHGKDVEELMINVDTAMYTAKKEGRGQHCVYSPESRAAKKRRDNYGAF